MHRSWKTTGIAGLVLLLAVGTLAMAQAQNGLDDDVKAALAAALDDEREARALYGAAIGKYDGQGPFAHIVRAEEHHEAHLLDLYEAYGLEVPEDPWTGHAFDLPETAAEACAQAVGWEEENATMFDRFLGREDLPSDVRAVFERLGTVSRERHLPAFQRCAAGETAGQGGGMHGGMGRGMHGGQGRQGGMHGGGMRGGQGKRGGGMEGRQGMQGGGKGCGCCGGGGMAGRGGHGTRGGEGGMQDGQGMGGGRHGGHGMRCGDGMQGSDGMQGGGCGGCKGRGAMQRQGMQDGGMGGRGMQGGQGKQGGCCRRGTDAAAPGEVEEGDAEDEGDAPAEAAETASTGTAPDCGHAAHASADVAEGSTIHDSEGPQEEVSVAGVMAGSACPL